MYCKKKKMSMPDTDPVAVAGFPGFDHPVHPDDPNFGYSSGSVDDSLLVQVEPHNNYPDDLPN